MIEPVEWENIKYTVNEENKEFHENITCKFKQFPLKPAWAITIRKSQGLTFDKVILPEPKEPTDKTTPLKGATPASDTKQISFDGVVKSPIYCSMQR